MVDEISILASQVEQLIDKYQNLVKQVQTLKEENLNLSKQRKQQNAKIESTRASINQLITNIDTKLKDA